MQRLNSRRCGVIVAFILGYAPIVLSASFGGEKAGKNTPILAGKKQRFEGRVVPLGDLLKTIGSRLDPAASPYWLALVTDDGKVYPLIPDDLSKMFFTDPAVRNRKMRLTGRLFAGSHLLQVLDVRSYKNGHWCDIYYWCDVCSIRRNAGGICECCGGPMELREVPLEDSRGGR